MEQSLALALSIITNNESTGWTNEIILMTIPGNLGLN